RAAELDVLARADLSGKIRDGPSQEPGAEVETEHEGRVGNRLEEERPVAGAVRAVGRLTDETRVLERAQGQRDGRLRDPDPSGDLGARDGRAGPNRFQHGPLVEMLE